nr:MAG TPA: hypothetical protein [Caudoviricetes sp.]
MLVLLSSGLMLNTSQCTRGVFVIHRDFSDIMPKIEKRA